MGNIVLNSRSENTYKKYRTYFLQFKAWCETFDFQDLPALPSTVAVYLSYLIQTNSSAAVINAAYYSIQWTHLINLCKNPCDNSLVNLILEGGKRLRSKPIVKKKPITPEILEKIMDKFSQVENLYHSRLVCMVLLGYAGFLRYDELVHIKMCDIKFHQSGSHIEIKIEKSKTDVFRQGNIVVIAKTGNKLCPVSYLEKYISYAGLVFQSEEFIFRAVTFFKKDNVYRLSKINKPLTYTRARELLLDALKTVGVDFKEYGLHSLRSGGATTSANNNVPDRLFKVHGRWRSENAKDGYVLDSLKEKLSVTLNLGL